MITHRPNRRQHGLDSVCEPELSLNTITENQPTNQQYKHVFWWLKKSNEMIMVKEQSWCKEKFVQDSITTLISVQIEMI